MSTLNRLAFTLVVAVAIWVSAERSAQASGIFWVGADVAGNGNWNTAANWNPTAVPGPGSTVFINKTGTFTINMDATGASVGSISLGGGPSIPTFIIDAGKDLTITGSLSVASTATVVVNGKLDFAGSSLMGPGSLTVAAGGAMDFSKLGAMTVDSLPLVNNGTLRWAAGAGDITVDNMTAMTNNGTFEIRNGASLVNGAMGPNSLTNNGTVRKMLSPSTATINVPFTNTATVDIQSGNLDVGDGTFSGTTTIALGSELVAASIFSLNGATFLGLGKLHFNGVGPFSVDADSSVSNLKLTAGGLGGIANLTITNQLDWIGGDMQDTGTLTIGALATATYSGSSSAIIDRAINNLGTFRCTTDGIIDMEGSASITNAAGALFEDTADVQRIIVEAGTCSFVNNGTYRKSAGSGISSFESGITVTNNGTFDIRSGTAFFSDLSNLSANELSGGTYLLKGILKLGFDVRQLSADVTLDGPGSMIEVFSSDALKLSRINSGGALRLKGGRSVTSDDQASDFTNSGVLEIGLLSTFEVPVMGPPAVRARSVSSRAVGLDFIQSSGTTVLLGGTLKTNGGLVRIEGGTLAGVGTIQSDTINAAQINLGSGPGKLDVSGAYTQTAAGTLKMRIGGTAVGSQYDQFSISGAATLNGTLDVTLINAFGPAVSDTFQLLTFASRSGTFSTINLAPVGDISFETAYSATDVTVTARARPTITGLNASKLSEFVNKPVAFAAVAVQPGTTPLTYTWDFGDGTPAGTGNPITHTYTLEGKFTVTLTVSDGQLSATASLQVDIAAPASGGSGIINITDGKPPVQNPLDGLTVRVVSSDGGVIEFEIDVNSLIREAFDINTDFDGFAGRIASRPGTRPVQKFTEPGIIVATSTATETTTGEKRGKARKQVPISNKEVGVTTTFTTVPTSTEIVLDSMKGKFEFNKAKPDVITFKGSVELPAGLDLSQEQTFSIGIANVIDTVTVNTKGVGTSTGLLSRIKKLKIKYPRVDKTTKLTTAGQKATIVITLSTEDMDLIGADTEGITAALRSDEAEMKEVPRSIQVAMVLGGQSYEGTAPVQFKLSKDLGTGQMNGRSSRP
jgi:PKD repeat protein